MGITKPKTKAERDAIEKARIARAENRIQKMENKEKAGALKYDKRKEIVDRQRKNGHKHFAIAFNTKGKETKVNVKVGDIFVYALDYRTPVVDFYEIVKVNPKTVEIRKTKKNVEHPGDPDYFVATPLKGKYTKSAVRRKVKVDENGKLTIELMNDMIIRKWSGRAVHGTYLLKG